MATLYDDPRTDPQMLAAQRALDDIAAATPPMPGASYDAMRAMNDQMAMRLAQGGPTMVETREVWAPAQGRRVLCRLHRPTESARATILYLHGGGWVWSSIDTHDRVARELAAHSGCVVLSMDYALAPEARFPQAVLETAGVADWIRSNGAAWNIDGARLVLAGDSAGGNLALAAAILLRDGGAPPAGVLALYPVCDFDPASPSYTEFGTGYGLTAEAMIGFWDLYAPDPATRANPFAAPLRADLPGLPPVMLQLAELDVLRSEGEAMASRLREAGVDVTCEIIAGLLHGYARACGTVDRAWRALEAAGRWAGRQAESAN